MYNPNIRSISTKYFNANFEPSTMVRTTSYTSDECTALDRCHLGVSQSYHEQNSYTFNKKVAQSFARQPEAIERVRTAASYKSSWHTLQSQLQKYLTSERMYYSEEQPSSSSDPDKKCNIMLLYCKFAREVGKNGIEKDAPPM